MNFAKIVTDTENKGLVQSSLPALKMEFKAVMTDYNIMKTLTFADRDEFARKAIAEKIIKLLDSPIDVSPLIIDGKWGTGKTEFCFKLKNLIEAENPNNYKVGYINAFQADHANEPLLALIAEVASFYDEKDEKRKNFIKDAIPYLRLVSGIGIKALVGFAFGRYAADAPELLKDGLDEIKEGSESLVDQSLESLIKDQVEAEKNLATLRDALSDIAKTNPVILLIDELDRCRPDFAIMMLETIKHVFDVENVQIVLVTNADQLKATIKHSYGSETNSHDYLYKFFKYQINLPTSTKDEEGKPLENNVTYFRTVIQASNVVPQDFKDNEFIYEIPTFLDVGSLSLRKIEQIVRCIETLVIFENSELSHSPIVEQTVMVFLSFVYMMDDDLFKKILNHEIPSKEFLNFTQNTMLSGSKQYERLGSLEPKDLILCIFNKLLDRNCLLRANNSYLVYPNFDKYNFANGIRNIYSHKESHSEIYNYIDHTVNNLLLFDIIK